jgi:hypothetical protein
MRTKEELDRLRERAIALRRGGKSNREIKAILGPMSKPLRDSVPKRYESAAEGSRQYWARERKVRAAHRANERNAAAAEIGGLSNREVVIAGAIAYWCEGSKTKPYARGDRVIFTNSDPRLILFFLRFLDAAGISRSDLRFCLQIHESADVAAAQRFWIEVTGSKDEQLLRPTLKRHNPKTTRKNVGDDYHGCLRIEVRRGTRLYGRIEGWATAVMAAQLLARSRHHRYRGSRHSPGGRCRRYGM